MPRLDPIMARYKEIMERNRWAVVGVVPRETTDPPPWAYTVGLTQFGFPELVMTGISPMLAQPVLNSTATRLLDDDDFKPVAGDDVLDPQGEHPLRVVEVSPDNVMVYLKMAVAMMPVPVKALQLVWQGPEGRWPWESDRWGKVQRVLSSYAG